MPDPSTNIREEVSDQTPSEEVSLFNDRKSKIKDWIASKSPILGSLYSGAVTILYTEPPTSGWPQLVAHAIREIANRLPDHIAGPEASTRGGFNLGSEVRKISNVWRSRTLEHISTSGPTEATSSIPVSDSIPVPREIYLGLSKIVQDDNEAEGRKYRKAKSLFEALVPEGNFEEKEPIIEQWVSVTGWFADGGRVHVNNNKEEVEDIAEYKQNFEMVEHILLGLIESSEDFSQLPAELNEILENTNN